jgi:F-type H+-transporting ATPase subunit c
MTLRITKKFAPSTLARRSHAEFHPLQGKSSIGLGPVAYCQTQSQTTAAGYISSGFGMAIASGLCGLAQARAVAASAEGMARNPGASAAIRFALLLGLILIESLALYTLVVIFVQIK